MKNLFKKDSGISAIALIISVIIIFTFLIVLLKAFVRPISKPDSSTLLDIDSELGLDVYIEKETEKQLKEYNYTTNDSLYVLAKDSDFEIIDSMNIMTQGCYKYIGSDEYVIVPNIINGKKQLNANGMFMDNSQIKGVKFEDGYENFFSTFATSESIQEVIFPNTSVDLTRTFENCVNLIRTPIHPDSIRNMKLTYSGCEKLTQVAPLPLQVETLTLTFSSCKSLKTAPIIPSSAKDISDIFLLCPITGNLVCGIKDASYLRKASIRNVQYTNIPLTIYVPNSVVEKWKSIENSKKTTIIGI